MKPVYQKSAAGPTLLDFHPTPEIATRTLLKYVSFRGPVWEPASGNGAISRVLKSEGYKVESSDLQRGKHVYGRGGIDFLRTWRHVENVVTNPPYRLLNDFIVKANEVATRRVALLVNLNGLFGKARHAIFKQFPPTRVLVLSRSIPWFEGKTKKWRNGGTMAHAWVVWDKSGEGFTELTWALHEGGATEMDKEIVKGVRLER